MGTFLLAITLMFSGQEHGRWDPCECNGRPFPGVAHRSGFLESLRSDYKDASYFLTGDLLAGKSNVQTIRAALDILKTESPLFLALGEKDMETSPETWAAAVTGNGPREKKAEVESSEAVEIGSPLPFPVIISNGAFSWARRYLETNIEGRRFIFLNFVDPLAAPLEWNLVPIDWAISDLETLFGLWQVYPEDIFTIVILHMSPADAYATARANSSRWNLVIVPHEEDSATRFLDQKLLAVGGSPCGDIDLLEWDIFNYPGTLKHRRVFLEGRKVVKPSEEVLANLARIAAKEKEKAGEKSAPRGLLVGTSACEPCHAPQVAHWKTTKHGKRFDGDVKVCGGCHAPLADLGERTIGCETCHTGGSRHIFSHTVRKLGKKAEPVKMPAVDPGACTTCHKVDGTHIKAFPLDEYWKRIIHPAPSSPETRKQDTKKPHGEPSP